MRSYFIYLATIDDRRQRLNVCVAEPSTLQDILKLIQDRLDELGIDLMVNECRVIQIHLED